MDLRKILRATSQGGGTLETQRGRRINLLDAPDLNLGTYQTIPAANRNNIPEPSQPVRMIDLSCDGRRAQTAVVTIAMLCRQGLGTTTSTTIENFIGGPLTGIIEFGNGSAFSRIEFDLQEASITPSPFSPSPYQLIPPMGAVSIPICASSIRVYVRNDATMPLVVNPDITIGHYDTLPDFYTIEPEIGAFVGYGLTLKGNSNLYRTIYIGRLGPYGEIGPVPYGRTYMTAIGIPAYSRFVRILGSMKKLAFYEIDFLGPVDNLAFGLGTTLANYSVAINDINPIPVPPGATQIKITNMSTQRPCVTALFELSI